MSLVGRSRELGELTRLLDHAESGRGGVVVVTGPPGVGKTAVADAGVEQAASGVSPCCAAPPPPVSPVACRVPAERPLPPPGRPAALRRLPGHHGGMARRVHPRDGGEDTPRVAFDWISFTSDYGLDDGFVAACAGVIGRIAPGVRIIDVTHTVPPQDVRRGAAVLARTAPYLPPAVHLAVVDPGVGTARHGVVVVAAGGLLVGPDNGLLLPAADAMGGLVGAFELADAEFRLPAVSATFHGRDVFAPAAAHLASGVPVQRLGPPLDPATLVRLPAPVSRLAGGRLETEVVTADRFGNVQLAAAAADLAALELRSGTAVRVGIGPRGVAATMAETFEDVPPGALLVHVDSAGLVELAVNRGSAADRLGVRPGDAVHIGRAG